MSRHSFPLIVAGALLQAGSILEGHCAGFDLFVSDYQDHEILRFDGSNGAFRNVFIPARRGGLVYPGAIALGPDGHLYVISGASLASYQAVLVFDRSTGSFLWELDGGTTLYPSTMLFGPDGYLYLSTVETNTIRRYDVLQKRLIDVFVPSDSGGIDWPRGFKFGPDGDLYVCSWNTDSIMKFDGETGAFISVFVSSGSGGLSVPSQLVFGSDGDLYVGSFNESSILRYDGETGAFMDVFVEPGSGGLNHPAWIDFGPDGNLYASSPLSGSLLRFDGGTGAFIDAFVPAGIGGMSFPTAFSFVPEGVVPTPTTSSTPPPSFTPTIPPPSATPTETATPEQGPTNAPPSMPIVDVEPEFPTTMDDLHCTATGSVDPEGEEVTYRYSWFRDSELVAFNGFQSVTGPSLSHVYTARGQDIECIVTPFDGKTVGPAGSDSVVIQNTPPSAPVVRILPEHPRAGSGLAVWIEQPSVDIDEDFVTYLFRWWESDDGMNWNLRPELSGNETPFIQGQPEISGLYTQVVDYWKIVVSPVEFASTKHNSASKESRSSNKGLVVGGQAEATVYVAPDLNEDGILDSADMILVWQVWGKRKGDLPLEIRKVFFDVGDPSDATIGPEFLFRIVQRNWYR